MSKNTDALRKLGAMIKAKPGQSTEDTGFIIIYCADEIDRLRSELESVRVNVAKAIPFINQACHEAAAANDPENCEI